ncbi:ABC transporter permease [Actinosynnema pretiosum]|uniref:ABC transporter permease n=1 Tax=Actinosynnema pretiosum TaxID=42197 RepID=A0A290Z0J3_9PSEU|nr:ABC transporter permease [Actinosynnema pretiosum]ATE52530.1 ABC transporter permease [Actinosynnema pretiosum]
MSTTTIATPAAPATAPREVDNRSAYVAFGLAYLLGHGGAALSHGADPVLAVPGWLPTAFLATGLAAGSVLSTVAAVRAKKGLGKPEATTASLLGAIWVTGFAALFLLITALADLTGSADLQSVLWPTGSALVVGLIYLAEGSARRNALHYALGTWLALVAGAAIFLGGSGLFGALAVAGGGAYLIAAVLERRRLVGAGALA